MLSFPVVWGSLMGLMLTGGSPAIGMEIQERCGTDIEIWAGALTTRLPLYANLQRAQLRAGFRVVLVGIPEIERLDPQEALGLGAAGDEVYRLYFSTLERQMSRGSPDPTNPLAGRRSDEISLAYRAYVVRGMEGDPWTLFSLEIKGAGSPVRDVSEGGMAQAIRRWQGVGCPG